MVFDQVFNFSRPDQPVQAAPWRPGHHAALPHPRRNCPGYAPRP